MDIEPNKLDMIIISKEFWALNDEESMEAPNLFQPTFEKFQNSYEL